MTQETIDKLDLSSTIDPETLRDNANSIDDHIKAIEILSDNLTAEDLDLKVRLLGQIGSYSRRINHLAEAKIVFTQAIQIAKDNNLDQSYIIANSLRLAHTFHWLQDYKSAYKIFDDIITVCKQNKEYNHFLDFAYQHLGKCYFDDNQLDNALKHFELALELRNIKKDKTLLESTQLAINATNKKLQNNTTTL